MFKQFFRSPYLFHFASQNRSNAAIKFSIGVIKIYNHGY